MKTRVDDRLRVEAATFALRFACDDCVYFESARALCSLGYPAAPRRGALDNEAHGGEVIEFCKEFDLGGSFSQS